MTDPFVDDDGANLLEMEVTRLRQENRELRLQNTNLRARLALAAPPSSTTSDVNTSTVARVASRSSVKDITSGVTASPPTAAEETPPRQRGRRRAAPGSAASSTAGTTASNSNAAAPSGISGGTAVSSARLQEAVQQVKAELQDELSKHQKAVEAERAEKTQLHRAFEDFVSSTCEREAAYELVYAQLFQETEAQRALVRGAVTQLEEQRVELLQLREQLKAAASTAGVAATARGIASVKALHKERRDEGEGTVKEEEATTTTGGGEEGSGPAKKRTRTVKNTPTVSGSRPAPLPNNGASVPLSATQVAALASAGETRLLAEVSDTSSVAEESSEPRTLKIVAGGGALRKTGRRGSKRVGTQESGAASSTASRRRLPLAASSSSTGMGLQMPVAPVFSPVPLTTSAPATAAGLLAAATSKSIAAPQLSAAAALSSSNSSTTRGTETRGTGQPPASKQSGAVAALWQLLPRHAYHTGEFLPLWQHLEALRGNDRPYVLSVLVSLLLHLLETPPDTPWATGIEEAPLPSSFTSQSTSVPMIATAIRLLSVQAELAAQRMLTASGSTDGLLTGASSTASVVQQLRALFYRVCVASLRRWQQDSASTASRTLELWRTAVCQLYGSQPALQQLMQYTNTTAIYSRTRLPPGWMVYTAQSIFAQCTLTVSQAAASSSVSSSPTEAAMQRWRDLCDSVGWSTHAIALDRVETAAARCVALSRVGRGPYIAACAEDALLSLRLVLLYKGYDHVTHVARMLEQPAVLPMAMTNEIYAELVSLAVRDRVAFGTPDTLQHALQQLMEYVSELSPERCTSAEHFISAPRRSHLLAVMALLKVEAAVSGITTAVAVPVSVVEECHAVARKWLAAQTAALELAGQSRGLTPGRPLLLRDTSLGLALLKEVAAA